MLLYPILPAENYHHYYRTCHHHHFRHHLHIVLYYRVWTLQCAITIFPCHHTTQSIHYIFTYFFRTPYIFLGSLCLCVRIWWWCRSTHDIGLWSILQNHMTILQKKMGNDDDIKLLAKSRGTTTARSSGYLSHQPKNASLHSAQAVCSKGTIRY